MSKTVHMPRLDTILMVENAIKEAKTYPSKNQLFRNLKKQVQYPTFKVILDYLESSNKITYDKDGRIIWIFADSQKLQRLMAESTKEEIMSQIDLMLDKEAQKHIRQSKREIKEGRAKRFKSSKEAISWLRSKK